MKKIKITEDQAKRIGIINEDINPLVYHERMCNKYSKVVDEIYGKVINISIEELIKGGVNMGEINNKLNEIERDVMSSSNKAYRVISNLPGEDLDIRIDKASDLVNVKLTQLQLLTMDLEKIQNEMNEHKTADYFRHIKPIEI